MTWNSRPWWITSLPSTYSKMAGHPGQRQFRPGRLAEGQDLPPDQGAALGLKPKHVALNDEGQCLVALVDFQGQGSCIAELSLPGWVWPA